MSLLLLLPIPTLLILDGMSFILLVQMQYRSRITPNMLMQISLIRQGFRCCTNSLRQAGKVKVGWKIKSLSRSHYFLCSQDSQYLTALPRTTAERRSLPGSSFRSGTRKPKACPPEVWCLKGLLLKTKGAVLIPNGPPQLASTCLIWAYVEAWTVNQFNVSKVSFLLCRID